MASVEKKSVGVELSLEKLSLVVGGEMQTPRERHGYQHGHGNKKKKKK